MPANLKWKTVSTEYINRHIFFTARRDTCLREDGTIIDPYYVVELPDSATAVAITEEGKVVLVKQYRHPIDEVMYETPGGFIDAGEDPVTGMRRELLEETGYDFPEIQSLGKVAANPALLNNFTELFLATGGKKVGGQHLDRNEEMEVLLVSIDELIRMLQAEQFRQSLHVNCILLALLKLGRLSFSV